MLHTPSLSPPPDPGAAPLQHENEMRHAITDDDLTRMKEIARVSSRAPGEPRWTELAVFHDPGANRPWVAVAEGHSTMPGERLKRTSIAAGTLDRALSWFSAGEMADSLIHIVRLEVAAQQPRQAFETLSDALAWLYPGDLSDRARALAFERDFGMPERTTRNAMSIEAGRTEGQLGPWVRALLAALRYFDREAWEAGRDA